MFKTISIIFLSLISIYLLFSPTTVHAERTPLSAYSWDAGLQATKGQFNDTAHAWGKRTTGGAWGTGSVNYQAGVTAVNRASSQGTMGVTLKGSYCPNNSCKYGTGSGYKGLVQFWNDPKNFIAFGLINDPGVSPNGTTLMIEGSANGKPVGGYWPAGAISGSSHRFTIDWGPQGVSVNVDNNVKLGPYPVSSTNPSISLLSAARNTGDIADTTFTGVTFSPGSVVAQPIYTPQGAPYLTYDATLNESGTGTGHSAYINTHDANSNALAVGIQTDVSSPESNGKPYFLYERVQSGEFTYDYLKEATRGDVPVTLKWWSGENVAIMYVNGEPISNISMVLQPRLFFNAEGNARKNGDTVNSLIKNTQIAVGDNCPTYCGLNGSWNTSSFNFYGLKATNTNAQPQNGANFTVTGTVSGLDSDQDWDTNLVAGIGMIAQKWNGQ